MANNIKWRSYIELHIAVLLYGITAILGDLIDLNALQIVWWRVMLSSFILFFIVRAWNSLKGLGWKKIGQLSFVGVLIALHWVSFYGSIKLSNASIALVSFGTTPLFSSLIEPVVFKKRFSGLDTLIGIIIIPAMVLIVYSVDLSFRLGIYVGIISAGLSAWFTSLSKKYMDDIPPFKVSFIELSAAFLFLSLILPFFHDPTAKIWPNSADLGYLIFLAIFCTILAFYLTLRSLKVLTAFNVNLAINLEPVYGILLAFFILNDHKELNTRFYIGVCIILVSVFSYPLIKRLVKS